MMTDNRLWSNGRDFKYSRNRIGVKERLKQNAVYSQALNSTHVRYFDAIVDALRIRHTERSGLPRLVRTCGRQA
jgi:hypothetical protein